MKGIRYGRIIVTYGEGVYEEFKSVDLDSVTFDDDCLSFKRLRHGDIPCGWGTVFIDREYGIRRFEIVEDKQ